MMTAPFEPQVAVVDFHHARYVPFFPSACPIPTEFRKVASPTTDVVGSGSTVDIVVLAVLTRSVSVHGTRTTPDISFANQSRLDRGPEVEFWVAKAGEDLYEDNDWTLLPFLALSDGAHASVEDFAYFTVKCRSSGRSPTGDSSVQNSSADRRKVGESTSLFGISCTRQIRSDLLKVKGKDVTRSTVQKAVIVILSRAGMLGSVRERLGAVTAAWFGQADFTNTDILKEFQDSLRRDACSSFAEQAVPIGLSIREVIHEFKWQTLVLVKALLLQKKMLFFGTRCEKLCLLQFALISLVPNLMQNLQDCADPALDTYAKSITRAGSLRTSERNSLLAYMGLPLQLFGESSFFSPYTPLQQLDLLMDASTRSFVVGSTNSLLLAQKDQYCDVLVNLDDESTKFSILNPSLRSALALSAADRRWIDNITQTVTDTWDPANPSRPDTHGYAGSEDAIRLQFEEYILSLLSSVAYKTHHDLQPFDTSQGTSEAGLVHSDPSETYNDFNTEFITLWRQTPNYILFERLTKGAGIFDIIEPKHPTAGGLSIEDVQRRLAQGVSELHLDERVREGRETVGRVLGEGRERVGASVARFWKEVDDFRQRREGSSTNKGHEVYQRSSLDTAALKDDITNVRPSPAAPTAGQSPGGAGAWAAALRDRASKVQIQKGDISAAQISTAAKDNAAKAGQYLSSWGSWARDRSKGWGEGRSASGEKEPSSDPTPKASH